MRQTLGFCTPVLKAYNAFNEVRVTTNDVTVAKYLPKKTYTIFGKSFSLNPAPWNTKEHALIVVAYWGSCYAAYGW